MPKLTTMPIKRDMISKVPTKGKLTALRRTSTTVNNIIAVRAIPAMKLMAPQKDFNKLKAFFINPPNRRLKWFWYKEKTGFCFESGQVLRKVAGKTRHFCTTFSVYPPPSLTKGCWSMLLEERPPWYLYHNTTLPAGRWQAFFWTKGTGTSLKFQTAKMRTICLHFPNTIW